MGKKVWSKLVLDEKFVKRLGKETDASIARDAGCSQATVFKIRRQLKIPPKWNKDNWNKIPRASTRQCKLPSDKVLLEEVQKTNNMAEIARKYNATRQAVSLRIKKLEKKNYGK